MQAVQDVILTLLGLLYCGEWSLTGILAQPRPFNFSSSSSSRRFWRSWSIWSVSYHGVHPCFVMDKTSNSSKSSPPLNSRVANGAPTPPFALAQASRVYVSYAPAHSLFLVSPTFILSISVLLLTFHQEIRFFAPLCFQRGLSSLVISSQD